MAKAKEIEALDCDGSASREMLRVLRLRFEEMTNLQEAALTDPGEDGVHDMRVASRRLRSLLSDFSPFLGNKHLASANKALKLLARSLGSVRDEDVAIRRLEEIIEEAPPEVSGGVREFAAEHRGAREAAHNRLSTILAGNVLAELKEEFLSSLQKITWTPRYSQGNTHTLATEKSFRELAQEVMLGRLKELEKLSGSLNRPLKTRRLHEMRIAGKRLRYALELFEQCFPGLEPFANVVADLQTSLGELHDCDVWIKSLGSWLGQTTKKRADNLTNALTSMQHDACYWLLGHFLKLRTRHFRDALALWRMWELEGTSVNIRECIEGGGRGKPTQPESCSKEDYPDKNLLASSLPKVEGEKSFR